MPPFHDLVISWWTSRLFPFIGYFDNGSDANVQTDVSVVGTRVHWGYSQKWRIIWCIYFYLLEETSRLSEWQYQFALPPTVNKWPPFTTPTPASIVIGKMKSQRRFAFLWCINILNIWNIWKPSLKHFIYYFENIKNFLFSSMPQSLLVMFSWCMFFFLWVLCMS